MSFCTNPPYVTQQPVAEVSLYFSSKLSSIGWGLLDLHRSLCFIPLILGQFERSVIIRISHLLLVYNPLVPHIDVYLFGLGKWHNEHVDMLLICLVTAEKVRDITKCLIPTSSYR